MSELISVIVTTYNREDALDAVLRSLARQNDRNFEVVVADDGSGPATAALVEQWKPRLGVQARSCLARASRLSRRRNSQPRDPSHRAATISCSSMAIAWRGRTLSRAHRRLAEPGWFVTGNRALLSKA